MENLRKKLTELLDDNAQCSGVLGISDCETCPFRYEENCYTAALVEYLIANGVTFKETDALPEFKEALKTTQLIPIPNEQSFDYYKGFYEGVCLMSE